MDLEKEIRFLLEALKDAKYCKKECCEDDEDAEIFDDLNAIHSEFMRWCFGISESVKWSFPKSRKYWQKLHPELPIPRVLTLENSIDSNVANLFLMLDAYPMFLEEKNIDSND